ncbi:MAG TPA: 50S ribosomal protein L20 [Candidatus Cloacimonas sp.]|jgi:large subunit ribosomal protein L20|nr:50S ribosomal protein L20 [Candidatus Cloacimonas sp.]HNQ39820.1 50S ribosomal protein L20 [Candidatus Cloacimonas sp.]HNS84718.1 50S ribosomal protein L20 [Candidatus Cloacimonas sp.]HPH93890.1 50S ribosomal protein L20 [Candidatus Cloacimonas sp.]HPX10546.1 50S ribosomal protein L20 [Candidatus Cloacimonas sp.]
MPRTTNNVSAHRRRKKYMLQARGYYGSRSKTYRAARQTVERAMAFSFAHRKLKKRQFRSLWITRINAACRMNDINYSQFINGLHKANIQINRKTLAHLAWHDAPAFAKLVEIAKG